MRSPRRADPETAVPVAGTRPDALRPAHTDWLRHDLQVTGPAAAIADLREAAAGAGVIPWLARNADYEEEDRVHALLNPPDGSQGLSLAGARALGRLLRTAADAHHGRVLDAVARGSRACPFDLHALLPVPDRVLRLGPDDPACIAWLRTQWGVMEPLRYVRLREEGTDGRLRRSARLHYEFWSADWTPWAAFQMLKARWPAAMFDLRPDYGLG